MTNVELAESFHHEILEKKRYDLIEERVSQDFVAHAPIPAEWQHGHEGVRNWFTAMNGALANIGDRHDDIIESGDKVVIRWTGTGKHTGELMGIPPTNQDIEVMGIDIFRIENGKIAEVWQSYDQVAMLRQIGAMPG
jgi:steroid delta-isomerase-like uncharacterized protein